ncbi:MAG: metallophosphoesterase [Trueperaceae bacterium]
MTRFLSVVGALLAGLLVWGVAEPYRLVVERREARVPGLPPSWEGRLVALLSDLHIGMLSGNRLTASRAVKRIVEARPDLALLAGDFIHDNRSGISDAVALVRTLVRAGVPVYAVLGNHDYAMPTRNAQGDRSLAQELARALTAAGARVLHNEAVALQRGDGVADERLYLVGIGAHTPGEDRPCEALERVPDGAPRLVMMHHPASFDALPPCSAPFAVAGHTHGGQVRLPLTPLWRYLTYVKEVEVFVAGWIRSGMIDGYGQEGNNLYVSRGIGCSVAPLRLFCPPEVTLFTLRRAA